MKSLLSILLSLVTITAVGFGGAGCAAEEGPGTGAAQGRVEVRVTDAPASENVTSIMVTASSVEIHKAVAEQAGELERERQGEGAQLQQQGQDKEQKSNGAAGKQRAPGQGGGEQPGKPGKGQGNNNQTGKPALGQGQGNQSSGQQPGRPEDQGGAGWFSLAIPEGANTFDLIEIKGIEQVLAADSIEVGKYTQLRLVIDKVEVTLGENQTQEAIVPSGELKFVGPFDVVAGETTIILLDFDAEKSVTVTGAGKILVRPVVKLSVQQGEAGSPTAGTTEVTEEESRDIAEDFLLNSPTFVFDGIEDSLELVDTQPVQCSSCWQFTFEFESRHAGYGDRTGQVLAEVITPHQAIIMVEQGEVTDAVMDDKWDMLAQQEIGEKILIDASHAGQVVEMSVGDRLVVTLESNPTTGFRWELAGSTDQTVLELVGSRYQPGAGQTTPLAGAGGEEIWTFRALKLGETTVSLEYSQPWEGGLKAERTFSITVAVD